MIMTTKTKIKNNRRHVRYKPDVNAYARVDLEPETKEFQPTVVALIFSESYGGCGLVSLSNEQLQVGIVCRVQVGMLAPLRAKVIWKTQLDDQVSRLGLQYLE